MQPSAWPGRIQTGASTLRPSRVSVTTSSAAQPQLVRGRVRDHRRVVPGQLGQRLGQLLEPAVVGVGAVPDGGIGAEEKRQALDFGFWILDFGLEPGGIHAHGLDRKRAAVDDAVVERLAPAGLEVLARQLALPVVLDDVVRALVGLLGERRQDLVGRLPVEERRDQRLDDRRGPVQGARVAPALQLVRRGHVPVAHPRGLVLVEAQVDAQADLVHRLRELEVRRRVVDGVAAQDDEQRDLPAAISAVSSASDSVWFPAAAPATQST